MPSSWCFLIARINSESGTLNVSEYRIVPGNGVTISRSCSRRSSSGHRLTSLPCSIEQVERLQDYDYSLGFAEALKQVEGGPSRLVERNDFAVNYGHSERQFARFISGWILRGPRSALRSRCSCRHSIGVPASARISFGGSPNIALPIPQPTGSR